MDSQNKDMKNALEIFNQMKLNDIKPDVIILYIDGFSKQGYEE